MRKSLTIPLLHLGFWVGLVLFLGRINWVAPLCGDGWFHVIVVRNGALHHYIRTYQNGNPRIGEFFTTLSYASDWHGVVINTVSVLLLVLLIFAYTFKRLPKFNDLDDFFQLNIILALLWLSLPLVGLMFFFNPFVTNYLLGFTLLLLFCLPFFRFANDPQSGISSRSFWPLIFIGGIVAGMTNEHTVPPTLMALTLMFIYQHRASKPIAGWQWLGIGSLLLGYLLLYFAPGQGKRYAGQGQHIYDNLVDKLADIPGLISRLWSLPGDLSLALVILLLFSLLKYFYGLQKSAQDQHRLRSLLNNSFGFIIIAHLMVSILFISPKQGDKLFLGPVALMIMAFIPLANYWLGKIRYVLLLTGIIAILVNGYFFQMIYKDYRLYRQEFDARMLYINERKHAGDRIIYIKPYKTKYNKYIWGDDTIRIKRGMPAMGVYFDVDKITYPPGG